MNNIWYESLKKPSIVPDGKIFSIVWSVLYSMIFISFIMIVFKHTKDDKAYSYLIFFSQLLLNFLWVFCFFKLNNIKLSLFIALALALMVLINVGAFWHISHFASFLIVPYFIWCCFAVFLNYELYALNCK